MRGRLTGVAFLALLAACGRPDFVESNQEGTLRELIARADAIVAGQVREIEEVGPNRADGCSKLTRAAITAGNVLKGQAGGALLRYYYFSPRCGSSRNVSEGPQPDAWRIVFLRREGGYWRAVEDHWRDGIPLGSGGHEGRDFTGMAPERAIAELLLTPGDTRSQDDFASSLLFARQVALDLAGAQATGELLGALVEQGTLPVRAAACLSLREDRAIAACAGPILDAYGQRFARADFSGLSLGLVLRLDALSSYAEGRAASQAETWLPHARVAVGLPPGQRPVLASE